jgi:hypothetical protein
MLTRARAKFRFVFSECKSGAVIVITPDSAARDNFWRLRLLGMALAQVPRPYLAPVLLTACLLPYAGTMGLW